MRHAHRWIATAIVSLAAVIAVWTYGSDAGSAFGARVALAHPGSGPASGPMNASTGLTPITTTPAPMPATAPTGHASAAASSARSMVSDEWPPEAGGDLSAQLLAAIRDGSPELAGKAANFMKTCESMPALREGLELQKGARGIPAEHLAPLIAGVEREIRRCQVVTPELRAQRKALYERAMLGGVVGAAEGYGHDVAFHPPTPELTEALVAGLKADSAAGRSDAPTYLALNGEALGLSKREAYAYYLLGREASSQSQADLLDIAAGPRVLAGMTDADKEAAMALADELRTHLKRR